MKIYTAEDLIDARTTLGLSRRAAAYIARIPYSIWTEWERGCGYGTPPPIVFACLDLYANLQQIQRAFTARDVPSIIYPCHSCDRQRV
jgi:hypothetical protein